MSLFIAVWSSLVGKSLAVITRKVWTTEFGGDWATQDGTTWELE